jgi:hypothetical protein
MTQNNNNNLRKNNVLDTFNKIIKDNKDRIEKIKCCKNSTSLLV